MAIKTLKVDIKAGDGVSAAGDLIIKIYGSTDSYMTPIHTTAKINVDSDCTLTGTVVQIENVDVGSETIFKATSTDENANESSQGPAYDVDVVRPWNIANMGLWLDASDSSSYILNELPGPNLVQITDKSGNSRNATLATLDLPHLEPNYLNGRNVFSFDGTQNLKITTGLDLIRSLGGATIFSVVKYNDPSVGTVVFEASCNDLKYKPRFRLGCGAEANKAYISGRRLDSESHITCNSSADISSSGFILQSGFFDYSGAKLTQKINGSIDGVVDPFLTTGLASDSNSLNITIGSSSVDTSILDGYIAELIIYRQLLNSTEEGNVNNYLNTKWGLI